MLNGNKLCVITCVNDDGKYAEMLSSFRKMLVPNNMIIEYVSMRGEKSIFEGYQKAMNSSDAKYKIYIHQDVIILDKKFLINLLNLFVNNPQCGIAGVIGGHAFDDNGVWWNSELAGAIFDTNNYDQIPYEQRYYDKEVQNEFVAAIDGLLIATQYDINWRYDLFSGWHLYDVSQCLEFHRAGYTVGVVAQPKTACLHKCGLVKLGNYDDVRKKILIEYDREIKEINQKYRRYPLVTVLIPTYNRPYFLSMAIESVLAQTYPNIEIFISDNSPNEDTKKMMKQYLERYPNIKYEYHPEFDFFGNWNRLQEYDNPETEYINYLMDDDLFMPDKIEKMVIKFQQNPDVSIVTSRRLFIDENNDVLPSSNSEEDVITEDTALSGDEVGKFFLLSMKNIIGEPTTALIKKKKFGDCKLGWSGNEGRYMITDYPAWLKLLSNGKMIYLTEQLSCFRQHKNQDTHSSRSIMSVPVCYAIEIKYAWENEKIITSDVEIELCILNCISTALTAIKQLKEIEYNQYSQDYFILKQSIKAMGDALLNSYNIDLSWLDTRIEKR